MKKLISIIIIATAIFAMSNSSHTALAAQEYAMVVTEDACFYSDASCRYVKFNLPFSYFVKIVSVGSDYSRVIYMDQSTSHPLSEGYVANVDLDFSITLTSSPYPSLTLTAQTDDVLFADTEKSKPLAVISAKTEAVYYGKLTVGGETYLYVYSGGFVGYVRESCFGAYELPVHPDAKQLEKQEETSTSEADEPQITTATSSAVSIEKPLEAVIFAVIIIAALCLIYIVLRPDKSLKSEHSYFDDNDDYRH